MRKFLINVSIKKADKPRAAAADANLLSLRDELMAGFSLDGIAQLDTGNGSGMMVYKQSEGEEQDGEVSQ